MRQAKLLLLLILAGPLFAEGQAAAYAPTMPEDMDQVDVSLITVGRGPQIYALYGHTILRVVDRKAHRDLNFNWGIFDFEDPSFAWKFYLGDLNYMMVISDNRSLVDHYLNYEHRAMWEDRINLTALQKRKLMERLIWNSQPENIHYAYSQFRDNCVTKPRDYLDEALGGKIRQAFGDRAARVALRHHIKRDSDAIWWVHMGLDTLSNSMLDRPVAVWDEMFLPENFRTSLREMPAFDDTGAPVFGRNLLEQSETVLDLPEPPKASDPYLWLLILLGLPMAAMSLCFPCHHGVSERRTAVMLGIMSLSFGLWSAVWGTVMTSNWLISHYAELKHNAGLWLLWPLDWVFVAYGVRCLIKRVRPGDGSLLGRLVGGLALVHLAFFGVGLALWLVGAISQDMSTTFGCMGLIACIYYGSIIRQGAVR